MLPAPQSVLWNEYLAAENRAVRRQRNAALERFLDAFATLPTETQLAWAFDFATRTIDGGEELPVRMPLFRRVLLPALRNGIADRRPGAARCLAGFAQHFYAQHFYGCAEWRADVADGSLTEIGLLRTALEHDPNDDVARRKFVDAMARQLQRSIHELPSGVLYGQDGATIPQCQELMADLDEFREHANRLGIADDFADLISTCRFHFGAYPEYLADRKGASSYAEFLSLFE